MKQTGLALLLLSLHACTVSNAPIKEEKVLTFVDAGFEGGTGYFYVFKTGENKNLKFIENDDTAISLLIKIRGDAYPNKKLLGKKFQVNFEPINNTAIEQHDSVYSLKKLALIDPVENYNQFEAADYTPAPDCADDNVINLLEVRCYDSLFIANEKLLSTYDFLTLAQDAGKLTCDCECKIESSNRKYLVEYKVQKKKNGEINIALKKK